VKTSFSREVSRSAVSIPPRGRRILQKANRTNEVYRGGGELGGIVRRVAATALGGGGWREGKSGAIVQTQEEGR
jgi:hypothetical protein